MGRSAKPVGDESATRRKAGARPTEEAKTWSKSFVLAAEGAMGKAELVAAMVGEARAAHGSLADLEVAVLTAWAALAGLRCWTAEMVTAVRRELER